MRIALVIAFATNVAAAEPSGEPPPHTHSSSKAIVLSAVPTVAATLLAVGGLGLEIANAGSSNVPNAAGNAMMAVGGVGLVVAPSLGHLYGEHRWWTNGAKVRMAGLGVFAIASLWYLKEESYDNPSYAGVGGSVLLGLIGLGAIVTGAAMDVATAGSATDRYNERVGASLRIAPTVIRTASHTNVGGLALVGSF
jgi:hypothetical protein